MTPSFRFQVVAADPDDNIFTDRAITADADYLITEDTCLWALGSEHQRVLRQHGKLSAHRYRRLNELGFCWRVARRTYTASRRHAGSHPPG